MFKIREISVSPKEYLSKNFVFGSYHNGRVERGEKEIVKSASVVQCP